MKPRESRKLRPASDRRLRRCAVLVLALLTACAAPRPHPTPAGADPDAVFSQVRAREDRIRTLRARFDAETWVDGQRRRASGVLLVAKPDRFRLRLMLPFGLTVLDYLSVGDRSWLELPLQDDGAERERDDLGPFSRTDLGSAFLRGRDAFPPPCAPVHAATGALVFGCPGVDHPARLIDVDPRSATITEERSLSGGEPRMIIRYDDYRVVDGVALPFRIGLDYPRRGRLVEIEIDAYEVNPTLSEELFQPVAR